MNSSRRSSQPKPSPRHRRHPLAIVALFLGVMMAIGLYWLLFGLPFSRPDLGVTALEPTRTPAQQASYVQDRWRQLTMTPLGEGARSAANDLESIISSTTGLTASMRVSLAKKIDSEIKARSGSPEDYITFAEDDPTTRWLVPGDSHWTTVDAWWGYAFGRTPTHTDAKVLLGEFLADLYDNRKGRWTSCCGSAEGIRLMAFTVRQPDELYVRLDKALSSRGETERELWLRSTSSRPVTFRTPLRGLEEIIRTHGVAQAAVFMMIVETEGGERYNWSSVLVWDPGLLAWTTESCARKGWTGTMWY